MVRRDEPAPLLDDAHAAFVVGRVAIVAASRDAANVPSVTKAYGCRLSPNRRRVTIFVATDASRALLDDVRATRALAAVFCQPSTNRSFQLKGLDASEVPLAPGDREAMAAHLEYMIEELALIGFAEAHARASFGIGERAVAAIAFTPSAAFVQTPGPRAGTRLGA